MRKLIISYLAVFLLYFINQDNVFSQTRTASGVYYKNKLKSSKSDCNVGFTADKTGPFCINNNDSVYLLSWDTLKTGGCVIDPGFVFYIALDEYSKEDNNFTLYEDGKQVAYFDATNSQFNGPGKLRVWSWNMNNSHTFSFKWCDKNYDGVFPYRIYDRTSSPMILLDSGTIQGSSGCTTKIISRMSGKAVFSGDGVVNNGDGSGYFIPSKAGAGTHVVTYSWDNESGFSSSYTMSFIVNPLPAIELGKDTTICHGSKLVLHAGKNYAIYRWNDNSQKDSLNVKASGKYSVTVTDNIGCVNRDSVTVKLDDMKVELGKDDSICSGSSVLLDAGISPATYRWNDDSKQKTLNVSKAGTYKVTVTDEYKCVSADSVKIFIYQAVKVNLGKDRTINNDSSIVLHAGGGYKSYVWQDGSTDSTLNVNKKGQYIVTVTTFEDCVNSDTVNIEVTCFSKDVFVPDVFTPGNSSSICNSYFRMQGRCIGDAELQVFNRWGAKVYDNTYNFTGQGDASVCNNTSHQDIVGNFSKMYYYLLWDGRDKSNGNLLAQGLYYYILNYNIMDEDVISRRVKKGSVVIVR